MKATAGIGRPRLAGAMALAIAALGIALTALGMPQGQACADEGRLTVAADLQAQAQAQATDGIEPGVYYIQSALSGAQMLDVAEHSKTAGANIQTWETSKGANQRWRIAKRADGTYTIRGEESRLYLGIAGGSAVSGANIEQQAGGSETAQRWRIVKTGSAFTIESAASKTAYALDVADARAQNGANVQLYRANSTSAQKWHLIAAAPKVASERTVADGAYELRMASKTSYAVEVAGASAENGANVQLGSRAEKQSQRWYVKWEKDGYYSLRNLASGKMLEVAGAGVAVRTNVCQGASDGSDAQRWAVQKRSGGTFLLVNKGNGLVLDIASAKAADGTNVRMWVRMGGASQRVKLASCELLDSGFYTLTSMLSGGTLDVGIPGGSAKANVQAQIGIRTGSIDQRLQLQKVADGTFTIRPVCSGMYLADVGGKVVQRKKAGEAAEWRISMDGAGLAFTNVATGRRLAVKGGKGADGAKLICAKAASKNAQRFRATDARMIPAGYYEVRSASAKRLVEVAGGSSSDGAAILLRARSGEAAQCWQVEYAGNGYYRLLSDASGKALASTGAKKAGAKVRQRAYDGSDAQLWKPRLRVGGLAFVNKKTGFALEAAGAKDGAAVREGASADSAAQTWTLAATSSRSLSGNAELDAYARSIAAQCGYDLRSCFNWVTANIRWTNSVSGEVLASGIVDRQRTVDFALYAFRNYRGDCYYYASAMMWLARACGYSAEVRAGYVPSASQGLAPHGWTEVYVGGQTYICDPNLAVDIGGYNWYMVTYASAPVQYYL